MVADPKRSRRRKVTQADCAGCRDDFYNHSSLAMGGCCWSLKDAKIATRFRQHVSLPTIAANIKRVRVPSCYRQQGFVHMDSLPAHINAREVHGG